MLSLCLLLSRIFSLISIFVTRVGAPHFLLIHPPQNPSHSPSLPLQDRLDHLTTHVMDVTLRTHDRTHFDVFFFCFLRLSSTVTSPRRRLSQLSFDTTRISPIFARACAFMTRNAFGVEGSASTKLSTTHTHSPTNQETSRRTTIRWYFGLESAKDEDGSSL